MGYRDLNLVLRVPLPEGRFHHCEVQLNHKNMLEAKEEAHVFYENVRVELPKACQNCLRKLHRGCGDDFSEAPLR